MDNKAIFKVMFVFHQLICDPLYSLGHLWGQLVKDFAQNEEGEKEEKIDYFKQVMRNTIFLWQCGLQVEAQIIWQFLHAKLTKLGLIKNNSLTEKEKVIRRTLSQFADARQAGEDCAFNTARSFYENQYKNYGSTQLQRDKKEKKDKVGKKED